MYTIIFKIKSNKLLVSKYVSDCLLSTVKNEKFQENKTKIPTALTLCLLPVEFFH